MRTVLALLIFAACTTEQAATPDAAVDAAKTPVACDGALCDTTNNSTCQSGAPTELLWFALPLALIPRRRRR